jgi:hypothetical protein
MPGSRGHAGLHVRGLLLADPDPATGGGLVGLGVALRRRG